MGWFTNKFVQVSGLSFLRLFEEFSFSTRETIRKTPLDDDPMGGRSLDSQTNTCGGREIEFH